MQNKTISPPYSEQGLLGTADQSLFENSKGNVAIETLLLSRPWAVQFPGKEDMGTGTGLFSRDRYVFFTADGEVFDLGHLEIDKARNVFRTYNEDGDWLTYSDILVTDEGFQARPTTDSFYADELPNLVTFAPTSTTLTFPTPSSLQEAAKWGDIPAIDMFLAGGSKIDEEDADGTTPILHAINRLRRETVKHLLEKGANPSYRSSKDLTPLFLALIRDDGKTVELLLEKGADPNMAVGESVLTPLYVALQNKATSTARLLVKAGADVNAVSKDRYESIPLVFALLLKNDQEALDMVTFLVERGADIDAELKSGMFSSLLGYSLRFKFLETTKFLASKVKNPNTIDVESELWQLRQSLFSPGSSEEKFQQEMGRLFPKQMEQS